MTPPGSHFDEISAKPQNFRKAFFRMTALLWRPEMKRWRVRLGLALALTVVAKVFSVVAPVFMGAGINEITEEQGAAATAGVAFVGFCLLFGLARFLANGLPQARDAFFTRVTQDANRLIAVEAFAHAQDQSLRFHLTRRAGALNRIIERGAGAMEFMLRFLAFNIGPTIIELLLAAVVMSALYSPALGAAAVVTVALYAAFTVVVTEWRNKLRRSMNEADTELRALSMDTLTNFETVKAFAAEERETGRFNSAFQAYSDKFIRSMQSMNFLNAGQELIMTGGLVASAIIAGYGAANGSLKAGDITAVILMLTNIYRPLNILGFAWREIKQGAVDIEKLFDLLDLEPEVKDVSGAHDLSSAHGAIRFEHVSFVHDGRATGLDDVSFDASGGAFIGLVGPSGAGKSTILKLLFRFYDPNEGRILIDGVDIKDVSQHSLRASMGLVPQDVVLFNDTLRFNLAYARPEASDEDIMAAARRAQLGAFIDSLPNGLETRVGERGLKLSGGEKQRVGVARAILLDPPILILDEATSSLDSETEEEVQKALREAAHGRTTLAVAHRLSTIANADYILVLNKGRIVERGTSDELLASGGVYADLWRRQSRGGPVTSVIEEDTETVSSS
ncbi:MAG: ABC transporter ATP-binding protein/permease [Pseudomonadota bacterium]